MPSVEKCVIIGHTAKAILAGDVLKVNYLPGYIELWCDNQENIIKEAIH